MGQHGGMSSTSSSGIYGQDGACPSEIACPGIADGQHEGTSSTSSKGFMDKTELVPSEATYPGIARWAARRDEFHLVLGDSWTRRNLSLRNVGLPKTPDVKRPAGPAFLEESRAALNNHPNNSKER